MRRLLSLALCALPFSAFAQISFLAVNRTINIGTYNFGSVRVLPNGNFAAATRGYEENFSKLYIFNRNGVVLASQNLPNVRLTEMKVHSSGRIYLVGNYLLPSTDQSTYVGCFTQAGAGQWSRVIKIASNAANDGASDLDFASNGDVVVAGFVVGSTTYGYCLSLDGQNGAQNWKVTRADVPAARDIAIGGNGRIHIGTNTSYWQLSNVGATLMAVAHPAGVGAVDIAADDQSVYIVGRRDISGRTRPWIQRRDNQGVPVWAQYDPEAVGAGVTNLTDNYLYVEIDVSGYAHAKGTMAKNGAQVSRHARYSPSGTLALGITRNAYFGNGVFGRHFALDRFNEIYGCDLFYVATQPSNQSEITRYAPYPLAPRWRDEVYDAPNGGSPGTPRSIAVHSPSGDVIVMHGIGDIPGKSVFQVWRQQAMAIADTYVMTAGTTFNSPRSVRANDRYHEGAQVRLVQGTGKGNLTINTATGNFTYTPIPGNPGVHQFIYRLKKDGLPGTATTVSIQVPN